MVAMFLPLQPIAGATLSYVFLGTSIRRGTLLGGVVIAMGLIAVTVGRAAGARREARERERETSGSGGRLNNKAKGGGAAAGGGGSGPWIYD